MIHTLVVLHKSEVVLRLPSQPSRPEDVVEIAHHVLQVLHSRIELLRQLLVVASPIVEVDDLVNVDVALVFRRGTILAIVEEVIVER